MSAIASTCRSRSPLTPLGQISPPPPAPGAGTPLTLSSEVPADEGSVHVLQEDDALLRRHAQEVVEAVVGEAAVAEAQQADAVLQLPGQGCAGKDANHGGEPRRERARRGGRQGRLRNGLSLPAGIPPSGDRIRQRV